MPLQKHKSNPEAKKPLCFRTEERFFCRQFQCPVRRKCMKLVARWRP